MAASRKPSVVHFHEFCPRIGLNLTPAQRVIAKIGFGTLQLSDLTPEELAIAQNILGLKETDVLPASCRRYVVLSLGRGSAKTTLCAAYSIYCCLFGDASRCGPGDSPVAAVVAAGNTNNAKLTLNMVKAMAEHPSLRAFRVTGGGDLQCWFRRPDGRLACVEGFAASKGGISVRGRSFLCFLLDEAEFFQSESGYEVTDREVFNAFPPRLLPGGRGMLISTPWPAVETLMSEMLQRNYGNPQDALAFIADTLTMRTDDETLPERIDAEMARDPDNARREYFCSREVKVGQQYLNPALIAPLEGTKVPYEYTWPYRASADFGFSSDCSALVIAGFNGSKYVVCEWMSMSPEPGKPLRPSEVVAAFAARMRGYGIRMLYADQFYQESIRELLSEHGIVLVTPKEGSDARLEAASRLKACLDEGRVQAPEKFIAEIKPQMRALQIVELPGGRKSIRVRRKKGQGHADLLSATITAIAELSYMSLRPEIEPARPEMTDPAYKEFAERKMRAYEEERERAYLASLDRKTAKEMGARERTKQRIAAMR